MNINGKVAQYFAFCLTFPFVSNFWSSIPLFFTLRSSPSLVDPFLRSRSSDTLFFRSSWIFIHFSSFHTATRPPCSLAHNNTAIRSANSPASADLAPENIRTQAVESRRTDGQRPDRLLFSSKISRFPLFISITSPFPSPFPFPNHSLSLPKLSFSSAICACPASRGFVALHQKNGPALNFPTVWRLSPTWASFNSQVNRNCNRNGCSRLLPSASAQCPVPARGQRVHLPATRP